LQKGFSSDLPDSEKGSIDRTLDVGLAAGFGQPADGPGSLMTKLGASLGPLRTVLLKDAEGDTSLVMKPHSDAMPTKAEAGDRYQLSGEIARGGMGAVLRGRDVDLGRDLAVKVLLEKYENRPDVARRFIEEAQIGGQLQHPGVVPVYDIGRFGDRPYFTMKLVKGKTLAAIMSERTETTEDRPRLLGVALQVAQALAYAHAKGVIHRDLKPANIMVGAFGEVQVMDWGLAKVLAEGGVADEERASRANRESDDASRIQTARSTGTANRFGTDTEAGSILGTPAYMPPEQANGDIANLDRRADVFGLGAILCEILTGKPPYLGRSSEEVRRKAANGDLADATARLDSCGVDAELVALTKHCLSPEAIDRPKDAQGVVDALSDYLNGVQERLQAAERERAVAEVMIGEERKRRKVQLALAVSLIGLILGGGTFGWWRNEQIQIVRQRESRNAEAVIALLYQTEEALKTGDAARAAIALEAAQKRYAEGGAEKEANRIKRLDADLALLRGLDAIDRSRWTWVDNKTPGVAVVATRLRGVLGRYGADPEAVPGDEIAARVSASMVRDRIVSALDQLLLPIRLVEVDKLPLEVQREFTPQLLADVATMLPKTAKVRAVLGKVDADPFRDAVRDAIVSDDRAKFTELAGQPAALDQPPGFVAFLGESEAIPLERRRELLREALYERPGNLGLLNTMGGTYPIPAYASKEDGEEMLRWYQAAVAVAPANASTYINLGGVLCDLKRDYDGATACFKKAIELDPKDSMAHSGLGVTFGHKGQYEEAYVCFMKALELDPKDARNYFSLSCFFAETKRDFDAAIAWSQKSIELAPKDSRAYVNLGFALSGKGHSEEAIASFKKAIVVNPKEMLAYFNLGSEFLNKSQLEEAIACFKKAIELNPKSAAAHSNLGSALARKGQLDEAIASCRKAIELDPKSAAAHSNLGFGLKTKGQLDDAIASYRKAIALDPKNAGAHSNMGSALREKGQVDDAIACHRKAIALDPKNAGAHGNLGLALNAKGQLDDAIACYRKAIELNPKLSMVYRNLGFAMLAKGQLDEGIDCFKKAIELDPKNAIEHYSLAPALKAKGQLNEAIACYREAIELDPNFAEAHCNLGHTLAIQGRFAESLDALKRGHELGSKRPGWPYPSAAWVRQAEARSALEAKLSAFLKGEYQPGDNQERLGLAGVCQGKKLHHKAAGLYTAAFAADPKLADDLKLQHRYNAACHATLAAAGQGEDAAQLDDTERTRLRKKVLDWLGADLVVYSAQLEKNSIDDLTVVQQRLSHWQKDSDLAAIRDADALAKLPEAERQACQSLWADVEALLKRAQGKTP
jgi:tetratricopeptide (TPR) repeat protein